MRLSAKTALAALAALLLIPAATLAQDAPATTAAGPKGPIPYTALRRHTPRPTAARPAAATAARPNSEIA
ncbi:hypothetical protein MQH10_16745, partial [Phenylobacterium aquaticum]|nr:hypothetical protein [Phenylobacterium aquaticum]